MGFWGVLIANNLAEIVGFVCIMIVAGFFFTVMGRKLERQRLRRMGPSEHQAYLSDPKRWMALSKEHRKAKAAGTV